MFMCLFLFLQNSHGGETLHDEVLQGDPRQCSLRNGKRPKENVLGLDVAQTSGRDPEGCLGPRKGGFSKGVFYAELSVTPKETKIPKEIGPSSAFGTQSAIGKRGLYSCKSPLLKSPFSLFLRMPGAKKFLPISWSTGEESSFFFSPENAQEGNKRGGGGKTSRGDPHGKQIPTPLTSVRFAPPLIPFLLVSPLEIPSISLS